MKVESIFSCFFLSLLFSLSIFSQNKKISDSLELLFKENKFKGINRLEVLGNLSINHPDTEKKLFYCDELIKASKHEKSLDFLYVGLLEKGNALRLKSDFSKALLSYVEAGKIASLKKDKKKLGSINLSIASVYSFMGNHKNSINYFKKAIRILSFEKDTIKVGSALLNLGDEYINSNKLDLAKEKTEEAKAIFIKAKYSIGEAYALGNLGMIYAKLGDNAQAEANITQSIKLLEEIGEYYPICVYLTYMSDIYFEKGDKTAALNYLIQVASLQKIKRKAKVK